MKTWITQLRKGLLEYCVLSATSREETYGYQLLQQLKAIEELSLTESTVYPILNRLKDEGFVRLRQVPSASGPPRRYFSLTAAGRQRLREMDAYWDSLCQAIQGLRTHRVQEPKT